MGVNVCPKCGRLQDNSPECRWCGIIFQRYRQERRAPSDPCSSRDMVRRIAQVARWAALACVALSLLLVLHQSPPPPVQSTPLAVSAAEDKMIRFAGPANSGRRRTVRLDEAELNAWLTSHLAPPPRGDTRSNVRDLRVQLLDHEIRLYLVFEYQGRDFSLELQGRVLADNGYLGIEASSGKLGALPLPPRTLRSALRGAMQSAENRDKLRLPPDVEDIRVERRQFVMTAH